MTPIEAYADAAEAQCPRCQVAPGKPCKEIACKHDYKDCQFAICAYWRELPEPHLERVAAARALREARKPAPGEPALTQAHDEYRLEWSDGTQDGPFSSKREAMHFAGRVHLLDVHVKAVLRRTVTTTFTEWEKVP